MRPRTEGFKTLVIFGLCILLLLVFFRHATEPPRANLPPASGVHGDLELANYRLKSVNARGLEIKKTLSELQRMLGYANNGAGDKGGANAPDGGKEAGQGLREEKAAAVPAAPADSKGQRGVQAIQPKDVSNDGAAAVAAGFVPSAGKLESNVLDAVVGLEHVQSAKALEPARRISQGRSGVSLVIGIPTVHRTKQSYLGTTISSLVQNLGLFDKKDILFLIMIGETDKVKVDAVIEEVRSQFPDDLQSGMVDIIAPPTQLYPDFDKMRPSFDDPADRFKWRTKQVFDFAYMMMYARSRGMFYLQLEDDVQARPNYASLIMDRAKRDSDWVLLEFTYLGFIGKLFRSSSLTDFIHLLLANARFKPVDWLLDDWFYLRYCTPEKDYKDCRMRKSKYRVLYKPSLFQHIGHFSSLDGKIQKLQDRSFKQRIAEPVHTNPTAIVSGTVEHFQAFSLEAAYLQTNMFWGKQQHSGDRLQITFKAPATVKRVYIPSGNTDHPGDIFQESVKLQYLTYEDNNRDPTKDNWQDMCLVNKKGLFDCTLDPKTVPQLKAISVLFTVDSKQWILIPAIFFHS